MFRINYKIVLFSLMAASAHALSTDHLQPIHITADSSKYNYKTGVNEFTGNVKADQGTTHLTADRLLTKTDRSHKIHEIIAYGAKDRAHYWTTPKTTDPELHAQANIIKYYPMLSNITLEQVVLVQQGENSFQGELIHYNSINQTVTVPKLDKSRALIVYNPDK
jgi:lipopolysaccharide export system protein LptA